MLNWESPIPPRRHSPDTSKDHLLVELSEQDTKAVYERYVVLLDAIQKIEQDVDDVIVSFLPDPIDMQYNWQDYLEYERRGDIGSSSTGLESSYREGEIISFQTGVSIWIRWRPQTEVPESSTCLYSVSLCIWRIS